MSQSDRGLPAEGKSRMFAARRNGSWVGVYGKIMQDYYISQFY